MKRIVIIGGGISGLSVLHFLKKRYGDEIDVVLHERDASAGGTIRSLREQACLFESGPNGFLDSQDETLRLIEDLGISKRLIKANPTARRRYIQIQGRLRAVPANPAEFIGTSLVPFKDKCALIAGLFKKDIPKESSIEEYVSRRFSPGIAQNLVDPVISGICAGDIKRLHMDSAFPKFTRKKFSQASLCSFANGMGELIQAFYKRYSKQIRLNSGITGLPDDADITIVSTPAHEAAKIVENANASLSKLLKQMPYAPIAVAGLLYKREHFKKIPDGFGYLVPSNQGKEVLGVLIESNVYPQRSPEDGVLIRVMLGGMHHPDIVQLDNENILDKAVQEIHAVYGLSAGPQKYFLKIWPKAIPQYELPYPQWRKDVALECGKIPGLFLCANYLDGISLNDCVLNAKSLAEALKI